LVFQVIFAKFLKINYCTIPVANKKFGTPFFTTQAANTNGEKTGSGAVFRIFDPEFPCKATKAKTKGHV
jgi:hypothetical protein